MRHFGVNFGITTYQMIYSDGCMLIFQHCQNMRIKMDLIVI